MRRIPTVYLVTDRRALRGRTLLAAVEEALRGGVDAVQLREKDLDGRELFQLAVALRRLCHCWGAMLLINDRIDVAIACEADGVHLPANSFAPSEARALLGKGKLVGLSAHRLQDLHPSQLAGADFVVFGPIFDTPSKRPFGPPVGLAALAEAVQTSPLPLLAIGGVDASNAAELRRLGVHGVAAIRALLSETNPCQAAAELRRAMAA